MRDTISGMNRDAQKAASTLAIPIPSEAVMAAISGEADANFRILQSSYDVRMTVRGDQVVLQGPGPDVESLSLVVDDMVACAASGEAVDADFVRRAIDMRKRHEFAPGTLRDDVVLSYRGRSIHPKTPGQKRYVDAIRENTITFGVGPAGTGKTYLAMALAISALQRKEVGRIVLSRPILEAGENLGFLPGTLTEKVDPYIRPLYDALFDMVDGEKANALLEAGTIEIAPLAFMRGRTLNDSFVILDEAQNTAPEQMKMFLTRLGFGSKMVVTGDLSQSDLPCKVSGLAQALGVLQGLDDVAFCEFKGADVVRNPLVASIIRAYEDAAQGGRP